MGSFYSMLVARDLVCPLSSALGLLDEAGPCYCYAWLLRLNPMVYLMRIFHCTFYHHPASWPDPTTWLAAVVAAFGTLLIGYGIYKRCEPHYVFWL